LSRVVALQRQDLSLSAVVHSVDPTFDLPLTSAAELVRKIL
jgi:hypothetical protein